MVIIRVITTEDSDQFLKLSRQLDLETAFMMLEPGERTTTLEQQKERIASILKEENQVIFVAEDNEQLVGYIAGLGGSYRRNGHKADVVIGILQANVGNGLGTRLFDQLESWAKRIGLHKLELTVMAHNERAIRLYKKMGFKVEGVSVDSLYVNGRFVDELDMAKIL